MSYRRAFGWNHDFARLVRQLGFKFITDRPKLVIDWNLIGCVDIDSIVLNSEVIILEKHIHDIIYYSLNGEEIKILDPKFVKLFRLAQLTIEYLIFCLHYLDKGFVQLQDRLNLTRKENEELREELVEKEIHVKKYKTKITELLNTNKYSGDVSTQEVYECGVCKKQFITEAFLNAHQTRRRHAPRVLDTAKEQVPHEENCKCETEKLMTEIKALKERLNNTEQILKNDQNISPVDTADKVDRDVQVGLLTNNKICFNNFVQCNLIDDDKRNQLDTIRTELRQWKEDEAKQILSQLEKIKEKFNVNIERLHTTDAVTNTGTSNNELNFDALEDKLEKKLECNIKRLKDELIDLEFRRLQEPINHDIKVSDKPVTIKRSTFCVQHNSPVIIQHESESPSSSHTVEKQLAPKSVQTLEVRTKNKATDIELLKTANQSTDTIRETSNKAISTTSLDKEFPEPKKLSPKEGNVFLRNEIKQCTDNEEMTNDKPNVFENNKNLQKSIFTTKNIVDCNDIISKHRIIEESEEKPFGNQSIVSLHTVGKDATFLAEFKHIIEDVMNTSLQELGVDPQWKSIPRDTFESHVRSLQHNQKFLTKVHPNFNEFKKQIQNKIEIEIQQKLKEKEKFHLKLPRKRFTHAPLKRKNTISTNTPLKVNTTRLQTQRCLFQAKDVESCKLPEKIITKRASPKPANDAIQAHDNVRSIRVFHKAKSLQIMNRKTKLADKSSDLLANSQLEVQQDKLKSQSCGENSQNVLASIMKVKERVLSVFKTSGSKEANILQNVGHDELPNQESMPSNITQGVYKLTALDEQNNPIQAGKGILTITPVNKRTNRFPKTTQSQRNFAPMSSSSESEEENHNLNPNSRFESTPATKIFDPFMIKSNESHPKTLPSPQSTKYSETNVENNSNKDVTQVMSMYGNNFESSNSEQSFEVQNLKSASPPKRLLCVQTESNIKLGNQHSKNNLLKPPSSCSSVKKKVNFDLKSRNASDNHSSDESKLTFDSCIHKNKFSGDHKSDQDATFKKTFVDDGDTTSISSSVLDGSTKNTLNDKSIEIERNPTEKTNVADDLVLSDFDLSSA